MSKKTTKHKKLNLADLHFCDSPSSWSGEGLLHTPYLELSLIYSDPLYIDGPELVKYLLRSIARTKDCHNYLIELCWYGPKDHNYTEADLIDIMAYSGVINKYVKSVKQIAYEAGVHYGKTTIRNNLKAIVSGDDEYESNDEAKEEFEAEHGIAVYLQ